ncbi:MAG: putative type IIS restriction/modification [Gallionellaceae bacterium]|nr:MAG: putative type IIS restriction/modification [Gallionellaceae bacterium]
MAHVSKTPSKSLSHALLKVKPGREQFEQFKAKLSELVEQIKGSPGESEEHHKNHISDFLKYAFKFPAYFINTSDRIDLVVHNGKLPTDSVGVIIETKRPTNQAEMPSLDNLNVKAMQELVLYYLRERLRIMGKNFAVKNLIITNGYEWFIFDSHVFEKAFANNSALIKDFNDFEAGRLSGSTTDFFYKEIAKPAIEKMGDVEFTHFDLREKSSDKKLIALLKVFSPEHLLKLPFANDSNSLNKDFYSELLHIIGLIEVKDGSKKLIQRKQEGERNRASLLENAIAKMDALDKLRNFDKPSLYGETTKEQLFNVGLELVITWINRVLFLKLLEAQLIAYHKGDTSYAFLNFQRIRSFDDLDSLFFAVLARKPDEREEEIKRTFAQVPYLNSSLFEPTEIERKTLNIGNLAGEIVLPLYSATVLKDAKGKRRTGELNTLEYLFAFLEAYDFASEGNDDLKDDNKALINASVLGLIFEKINGYKDGSFFTPGFITMYMCRETLRRAVVQKFNEVKGWDCKDTTELYNKIEDGVEANTIINSLKICDPAVGSGHFLVSALNELIAIKSELGILQDTEGKRLKNYSIEIINDELLVRDEEGDEFTYNPTNPESARVQKTLFNEKQTLIENCLFGVDINPNSVKICRLRLWIELLKNAYYNADGQLETLPNIDINIKVGNSLISRFALDADLKDALKKSKLSLTDYRKAVDTYRNASSKEQKREMEQLIAEIKSNFRSEIQSNDPKAKRLVNLGVELRALELPQTLLEESAKEKKARKQKQEKLKPQFDKLNAEIEEIKSNKVYENAFEWRFEFPEALNDEGGFVGFDVVIGNPPYVFARENFTDSDRKYFNAQYALAAYQLNLYILFLERGTHLLKARGGLAYITPNNWLTINSAKVVREFVLHQSDISVINFYAKVFEDASVDTSILMYEKGSFTPALKLYESSGADTLTLVHEAQPDYFLAQRDAIINIAAFRAGSTHGLLGKIEAGAQPLDAVADVKAGLMVYEVGKGEPVQTENMKNQRVHHAREALDDSYWPYLDGRDVQRYGLGWSGEYLSYGDNLAAPRKFELFSTPRILVRQIPSSPPYSIHACYTTEVWLNDRNSMNIVNIQDAPLFLLGLLNSRLMTFWFVHKFGKLQRGVFPQFKVNELAQFPIAVATEAQKQAISQRVEKILADKKADLKSDTTGLDKEIDQLVYGLYGLTPEEIVIVEGNATKIPATLEVVEGAVE